MKEIRFNSDASLCYGIRFSKISENFSLASNYLLIIISRSSLIVLTTRTFSSSLQFNLMAREFVSDRLSELIQLNVGRLATADRF